MRILKNSYSCLILNSSILVLWKCQFGYFWYLADMGTIDILGWNGINNQRQELQREQAQQRAPAQQIPGARRTDLRAADSSSHDCHDKGGWIHLLLNLIRLGRPHPTGLATDVTYVGSLRALWRTWNAFTILLRELPGQSHHEGQEANLKAEEQGRVHHAQQDQQATGRATTLQHWAHSNTTEVQCV